MTQARSVVQCVTQTQSISAPAGLAAGANWDAHVFLFPYAQPNGGGFNPLASTSSTGGIAPGAVAANALNGGYNVVTCAAGGSSFNSGSTNWTPVAGLGLPASYTSSNCRLIAAGFEVVNTTAEINKQGSVTAWKQPFSPTPVAMTNLAAAYQQVHTVYDLAGGWPGTQSAAQAIPSSVTLDAAGGIYAVATLNKMDVPMQSSVPHAVMIADPANIPSGTGQAFVNTGLAASAPGATFALPFDHHGAIFTNLSNPSTLQVTARYYVEKFPTASDLALVPLSDPSAPFDPVALEIYGRCMNEMAVAVPVSENPMGEWFNNVLGAVSKFAPIVGKAVGTFIPGAGLIGEGLGYAANALSQPRALASQVQNQLKNMPQAQLIMPAKPAKQKKRKRAAKAEVSTREVVLYRPRG
jgi:hypothetical protein